MASGITGEKIWLDGRMVDWADANIHILTHTLHYGLGVFEGIRCYRTDDGRSAVFRLSEHIRRLFESAHINLLRIPYTQEEIIQAARLARIHQKIEGLPEGYESLIGERGARLSAGERQRIHIARAVLKNAPFFLLDEPTANLDPITEREILDTLFEIMNTKTALMITHRLVGLALDQKLMSFAACKKHSYFHFFISFLHPGPP